MSWLRLLRKRALGERCFQNLLREAFFKGGTFLLCGHWRRGLQSMAGWPGPSPAPAPGVPTRKDSLASSVLSMPLVSNLPCCRLLCMMFTALVTPRWMSCKVVAGKPIRSL